MFYIIRYNSPSSLRVSVGGLYKLDNCSVRLYNLYNKSVLWVFSVHTKNLSHSIFIFLFLPPNEKRERIAQRALVHVDWTKF